MASYSDSSDSETEEGVPEVGNFERGSDWDAVNTYFILEYMLCHKIRTTYLTDEPISLRGDEPLTPHYIAGTRRTIYILFLQAIAQIDAAYSGLLGYTFREVVKGKLRRGFWHRALRLSDRFGLGAVIERTDLQEQYRLYDV